MPVEPRVDETGGRMDEQTQPTESGLALETPDEIVR